MKIFFSYSYEDKELVDILKIKLTNSGHEVFNFISYIKPDDNIIKKMDDVFNSADIFIIIISKRYLSSKSTKKEYNMIELLDITANNRLILPILVDNSRVPSYLAKYEIYTLHNNKKININRLINYINKLQCEKIDKEKPGQEQEVKQVVQNEEYNYDNEIHELRKALRGGKLTLVCGAGVSKEAGIPTWDELLRKLLESMMNHISAKGELKINSSSVVEFNDRYSFSTLVIGKYLKYNIGEDFNKEVRDTLYSSALNSSELIDSIVNLIRPARDRNSLDSVITFNFDTILEENLESKSIAYKSIYDEGMKYEPYEAPIFHVHGYLPRHGNIPNNANLVFSEDAYHSQFIEPFSWSNLIQLNKLSQNTCLLVGLSLSDPNLRRLLDVASRKNLNGIIDHYIIKKRPLNIDEIDKLVIMLEEQDANELGLNVIWVNDFDEIPRIINEIAK